MTTPRRQSAASRLRARGLRRLRAGFAGAALATAAFGLAISGPAAGQTFSDEPVEELAGADQLDVTGEIADLDARFLDENGREVTLRDYLERGRPVVLTLNYFRCPMLCIATLNGLVDGLDETDALPGTDYEMVTVSFSEKEGPDLAAAKKQSYLTRFDKPGAADHWHFLTGEADQIRRLTDSVGFRFRYDEATEQYAHPSTVVFLTPEGRISLLMVDVLFQPRDLRFALVEASEGRIGSPLENFLLFTCFQWDPDANSYSASAFRLMRFAGLVTVVFLVLGVAVLLLRGTRHGRGGGDARVSTPAAGATAPGTAIDAG